MSSIDVLIKLPDHPGEWECLAGTQPAAKRIDPDHRSPRLPRETGALHRASMDLTRKLADLRHGR